MPELFQDGNFRGDLLKGDLFTIHFFDSHLSTCFDVDSFINFTERTLTDAVLFGVLIIPQKYLNFKLHLTYSETFIIIIVFYYFTTICFFITFYLFLFINFFYLISLIEWFITKKLRISRQKDKICWIKKKNKSSLLVKYGIVSMHTNGTSVPELNSDVTPLSPSQTPVIFQLPIPDSLSNQKHVMRSFFWTLSCNSTSIIFKLSGIEPDNHWTFFNCIWQLLAGFYSFKSHHWFVRFD